MSELEKLQSEFEFRLGEMEMCKITQSWKQFGIAREKAQDLATRIRLLKAECKWKENLGKAVIKEVSWISQIKEANEDKNFELNCPPYK